MSYVVTDIDKYLKKNKKSFYDLITKEWGRKDKDVVEIKRLWQEAEDAMGTNNQIDKFNKLKDKLQPMFDGWQKKIDSMNQHLAKYNETEFSDSSDQYNYDFGNKLLSFSDLPKPNIFENLDIGKAFGLNGDLPYNYEQMKKLALDYGYDYDDKEERKEFLKEVSKYSQQQQLDKIWSDDIYTSMVTPIAKEYARKNYDKIEGFGDLAPALAADFGVNMLMAKAPGASNLVAAPVAKGTARYLLNDVPLEDAAKTTFAEMTTNVATPFMLRGAFRWRDRAAQQALQKAEAQVMGTSEKAIQKGAAKLAKNDINAMADKAGEIQRKLKSGAIFDENGVLYKFDKSGKKVTPSNAEVYAAQKNGRFIDKDDYNFFLENKKILRGKQWGPEGRTIEGKIDEKLKNFVDLDPEVFANAPANLKKKYMEQYKTSLIAKMKDNLRNKRPVTEGMTAEDLSLLANIKPKEGIRNSVSRKASETVKNVAESETGNALGKDIAAYVTNLQGRSKYGGTALSSLSQLVPGFEGKISLEEKKVPNVYSDAELLKLKRMKALHDLYPDMFPMPQLPENYTKEGYTIEDIFGK